MRLEAGRDPLNEHLTALIGELSTRSPQFRTNSAEKFALLESWAATREAENERHVTAKVATPKD